MKLWALSDLHLGYEANRDALSTIEAHPDDWLVVVGDVGETSEHLRICFEALLRRFARVMWVPGNHELWTHPQDPEKYRGVERYERLVALCRAHGVLSPEDRWPVFPGETPHTIALMFLLYDYSFAPDDVDDPVAWAAESGIMAADERVLHPDPYPSRAAWCSARIEATRRRLDAIPEHHRTVLVNHWPLRADLVRLYKVPRFVPWCGTRRTERWHLDYRARVCVHGHLHMRATDWRDGVRFEEVAVGYPRHWRSDKTWDAYLREILPGPSATPVDAGPVWHR